MKTIRLCMAGVVCIIMALSTATIYAQTATVNTLGKGIVFTPEDKSYEMKLGARFQTRYSGIYDLDAEDYTNQMQIRRARLKLDGFVYSPKLSYKIQLSLASSNLVLDAVAKYAFAENWEVWFGQTKLPGNREMLNSSQKLQFVDRSLLNSSFTLDRDIGVHLLNTTAVGNGVINSHLAISTGEGRDVGSPNLGGNDYSGRFEYLPFGKFTNKGGFFGADLEREDSPKLMIGAAFDYNDGATQSRGQKGSFVLDINGDLVQNNLKTLFLDAFYKYKGFNFASEFATRSGEDNITGFGTGTGFVAQAGYLFDNDFETAVRFTTINPDDVSSLAESQQYTLGLSKYISGHNLKVQTDISYTDFANLSNEVLYRFQLEVAF